MTRYIPLYSIFYYIYSAQLQESYNALKLHFLLYTPRLCHTVPSNTQAVSHCHYKYTSCVTLSLQIHKLCHTVTTNIQVLPLRNTHKTESVLTMNT
jgi:hypothetical protein